MKKYLLVLSALLFTPLLLCAKKRKKNFNVDQYEKRIHDLENQVNQLKQSKKKKGNGCFKQFGKRALGNFLKCIMDTACPPEKDL